MSTDRKKLYFEELGSKFDEYMNNYDVEQRLEMMFSFLLRSTSLVDKKVLEVGCGTGRFSKAIVKSGGKLVVLDIGLKLVSKVSKDLSSSGVAGDALALPFLDESFDVVISSECIEHTSSPLQAIKEMCRICRPSGAVCITSPNRLWYPILLIAQKLGLRKFAGIENWVFPYQAAAVLRQEGLTEIQVRGCHMWPFQLKFTRPLLRGLDACSNWLYPFMINFGLLGTRSQRRKTD